MTSSETVGQQPSERPAAPIWALPAAVIGGMMAAVQARINSRLAVELDDGLTAAAISFGAGLLVLVLMALGSRPLRRRIGAFWHDLRSGTFAWPLALGGLGGATVIVGQGLSVAVLGVALFIVCVVAGQTVTGLVVDRLGLGPGGVRPLSPARVVGAGLMVVAVVLAMSSGVDTAAPLALVILPVIAGVAVGLQQAVNGRVTQHTGDFLVATFGNFTVGTAALVVAALAHAAVVGHGPQSPPSNPLLYLGGVIGVAYVALAAHLVHPLGVLTLAMATIAGQIVGSVLLDAFAPAPGAHLTGWTIAGAALTLVAAILTAGVRTRRRTSSRQ